MNTTVVSLCRRLANGIAMLLVRPRHRQVAALVWRRRKDGTVEVLTITTRRTKRWSVPKGWPIKGLTSAEAAAQEAWEEAGVRGFVDPEPLGSFAYVKAGAGDRPAMRMTASLFALRLSEMRDDYPEAGQRKRVWRTCDEAINILQEPDLQAIIRAFIP